ncbi:MAG: sugar phosphate isomerase/epimerase family protein [Vicinamibacterales bacterium]
MCNELYENWKFDDVCNFLKQAGYDGVEVAPFTLAPRITDVSPERRAALRAQAAHAGIQIIGLHWLLAGTHGLYLTSPDPTVRSNTAEYIVALAEAAHDLGGDLMVLGSPKQRSLLPGVTRQQAFDWAAALFREVMPRVADCGVTICMEPLSTAETDFINTCAEAKDLIDAVGHRNFSLHLDVKAMFSEPTPPTELIRQYGPMAHHFHANDANRRGPGFGDVDFVPIFQALRESGYNRWVSVEVFDYKPDPETITTKSIEYMQRSLAA